ncbi:MAG: TonB-dependent receptor [Mycobacterium sp.]|uniref:TonB-dependent receptor n=1 Tax=Mycobacterium sp. TaxID=1785 RepID=UPI001EC52CE2|nr:TonB-dependent receptor [Mycobacterium sp.]MBV8788221.1 TonB-dependent receptor [Mycobacterium sp.]
MTRPALISLFCASALVGLDTASAWAAEPAQQASTLQEVVVQARRSSENLQKVPVAVTAISQKDIDSVGVFDPQNLANFTPGLTVPAVTSDRNNVIFAIRGQSYSFGNQFNAVIPYYNDVPIVSPTGLSHGQFFDVDSVQVLRGPQGTQFGRVTDGGNVMIYPKKPSNSFDGYVEGKVGDYGLRELTGALNIPIIPDKLMVRGAVDINRRDGFTTNLYNGRDLDNVAYESYRFGIVIRPTEHIENYTSIAYEHTHENGTSVELEYLYIPKVSAIANAVGNAATAHFYGIDANGNVGPAALGVMAFNPANYLADLQSQVTHQLALGPRQVFDANPLFDRRDSLYVANTTTADLGVVTIKNVFGFIWTKDFEAQNFSGGNGQLILPCHSACPFGAGLPSLPFNFQEQFSDEFRLSGKLFDNRLVWSAGAYTDAQKPAGAFENAGLQSGASQNLPLQYTKTWETAGYGNAEYDLRDFLPGLKINGGIRYTIDDNHTRVTKYNGPIAAPGISTALSSLPHGVCVTFNNNPCLDLHATFTAITYTAGATYQFNPNQMIYAKVSRGYRPGGDNSSNPPGLDPAYNPEYDLSVEIGAKADFDFNGVRLRTNVALFHDNYTNIQQNVVLPSVPGQPSVGALVRNVDDAVVQGAEFEGILIPFRGMTLDLNYAYTDAAFKHLPTDPLSNPTSPCNPFASVVVGFCGENAMGFVPRNKLGLSADYELPLDPAIGMITFGGTWNYQSKVWLITTSNLDPHAAQPAYSTLDLRATWHQIYGHPVDLSFFMTNVTNQLYKAGVDDLEQASSLGSYAAIYAPPRMFGFGLKYRFGASGGQ